MGMSNITGAVFGGTCESGSPNADRDHHNRRACDYSSNPFQTTDFVASAMWRDGSLIVLVMSPASHTSCCGIWRAHDCSYSGSYQFRVWLCSQIFAPFW